MDRNHKTSRIGRFATAFLTLTICGGLAASEPILEFRGDDASGVFPGSALPAEWNDQTNVVWKRELPGRGSSSPIVLDGKIYLTCYTGYGLSADDPGNPADLKRHLLCVDRQSGEILWQKEVPAPAPSDESYQGRINLHGFATGTLTTDGERLYGFFGKNGAYAFTMDGDMLWRTDVGRGTHNWGSSNSPVLFENLVIINASVESSNLVALNKADGEVVWTSPGMRASWNTPKLVELSDGSTELVVSVRGQILGFDPRTGKQLWSCEGIQDYVCPSVISNGDVVYSIGGRRNTAIAVRAGGRGDVTQTHKLWEARKGSNVSSPIYLDGHLYWVHEQQGIAYCLDAETGEVKFEERLRPRPGLIYASTSAADGKLYIVSREGGAYVLAAEPRFELLSHNTFESDSSVFNASPVIHDDQLLLRSDRFLYCIGNDAAGQ